MENECTVMDYEDSYGETHNPLAEIERNSADDPCFDFELDMENNA